MAEPATTGKRCKRIEDMQIGDYIKVHGINNKGYFSGDAGRSELPLPYTQIPQSLDRSNNFYFYAVKVAKGLLVADRVIVTIKSISWSYFNTKMLMQGHLQPDPFDGRTKIFVRSLTGGVAYADQNGNKSKRGYEGGGRYGSVFGAWPTNNEWDRFIVNFPLNKVQKGKTLDDVFHWTLASTLCQDTTGTDEFIYIDGNPPTGNSKNTKITRGDRSSLKALNRFDLNYVGSIINGFRPVFEYRE
ncbi:hypothetical protein [Bacillus chungangensis]|uniref:Uncharacterized protein n=1 Tax=Bacillus chungangensis TaxID=587633 RepID=A0ABT9WU26_9BACI|nr:hypothetical protein [Bacillus chungangensis]MDQ0176742.1 hypothetical protein [Bacillus chungangensis]